jgi:predicted amidohydrolase
MPKTVRLATTQHGWKDRPIAANPYGDSFSFDIALQCAKQAVDENAALLSKAGEAGADLAVAGEDIASLGTAMTFLDDPSIFRKLTEQTAPYVHQALSGVARHHRMHVVASFYEPEGDTIFNSSVLFGRDGKPIGRYHKVHLPVYETWLVTAGSGFPAFDTDIGVVGMIICYDDMWPESTAACALNGARIICHSSAASPADYRVRSRAMDYQVFYVTSTYANSRIAAPNAKILADAGDGQDLFVAADVDVQSASLSPESFWEYLYSGIRDHRERHLKLRRPDAYGVLLNPSPAAVKAYPQGGVANTPKAIREVYEKHKAEHQRGLRGEKPQYEWKWSSD